MSRKPAVHEIIGVKTRATKHDIPALKRAALLFDWVHVTEIVVLSPDEPGVGAGDDLRHILGLRADIETPTTQSCWSELLAELRRENREPEFTRWLAADIAQRYGCTAVAAYDEPQSVKVDGQPDMTLRIVLQQLPLPTASTSWEAISDWRGDAEARRMYARLRTWMNRAARTHANPRETADEVSSLLADYETYMALHHRAMRHSRLEVVLTTSAEILEALTAFRWSTAVKRLLDLRRSETALLSSELEAPGREVAYIDRCRQRFGRK